MLPDIGLAVLFRNKRVQDHHNLAEPQQTYHFIADSRTALCTLTTHLRLSHRHCHYHSAPHGIHKLASSFDARTLGLPGISQHCQIQPQKAPQTPKRSLSLGNAKIDSNGLLRPRGPHDRLPLILIQRSIHPHRENAKLHLSQVLRPNQPKIILSAIRTNARKSHSQSIVDIRAA